MSSSRILETDPGRSALMKRVRRSDTGIERAVRVLSTECGARYRRNVHSLPGTPDLANKGRRQVVFVHGCFWHYHADCSRGRIPKRNRGFWEEKLQANRERDERKVHELQAMGYDTLVVWGCELDDPDSLRERLRTFWQPVPETQ